jgi:hypothetical protein
VAGPLAIIIGGYATPEARLRDLVILALSLTPFCMVLFGDLLNLPIPVFPQALTGLFPADWSQKAVLRARPPSWPGRRSSSCSSRAAAPAAVHPGSTWPITAGESDGRSRFQPLPRLRRRPDPRISGWPSWAASSAP